MGVAAAAASPDSPHEYSTGFTESPEWVTLTCRTLELGEDGLGLAVTLPSLLQDKVGPVSWPHLRGAKEGSGGSTYLGDLWGGLGLADVAQDMGPVLQVHTDLREQEAQLGPGGTPNLPEAAPPHTP